MTDNFNRENVGEGGPKDGLVVILVVRQFWNFDSSRIVRYILDREQSSKVIKAAFLFFFWEWNQVKKKFQMEQNKIRTIFFPNLQKML